MAGFQHLIDIDGWGLLLGVDIYRLSTMQYVEDILPDEIRNRFKPSHDDALIRYPENQWFMEAWVPSVKPWYKIQEAAYSKGLIINTKIGNAKCMLFKIQPVIALYRQTLLDDPFGFYGLM